MTTPDIGESFRGTEGHIGYLLRQAWHAFRTAMEDTLRDHGLTSAQYAALSVLAREPDLSGADLARACNTTPQAMNGVVATLERDGLVARHKHPTHGRILQISLTEKGTEVLAAATPAVRRLEAEIEADPAVRRWLVDAAGRLSRRR